MSDPHQLGEIDLRALGRRGRQAFGLTAWPARGAVWLFSRLAIAFSQGAAAVNEVGNEWVLSRPSVGKRS
jgi:hypothetical protein